MESMSFMFNTEALKKLVKNKFVVFIGDSGKWSGWNSLHLEADAQTDETLEIKKFQHYL